MFLSNFKAGEARDGTNDFWFQPAGTLGPTRSGVRVTHDTAFRLSTVFKIVKVISETIGMLPMHVYRMTGPETRERVRDDPLSRLLNSQPNRWQTPMQFRQMLEAHRDLRGNGYARIYHAANGEPDELVPLHPDRVTPEIAANGLPRWQVRSQDGSSTETLVQGEMFHLTGLCLDGYTGISPVQAQRESIGAAVASRDYGARFWNNDARPPFWVEVPQKFEDNEARRKFRSEWQAAYSGANQHRPAVLDRGMKLHELGITNSDAQWLESTNASEIDLCGIWRVPPHKIGILNQAKYANIEQQSIEFVVDCILPLAVSWEQTVFRDMIVEPEMFTELLLEVLLRGDTSTRYEAYGKAIKDGWMTRNEVRRLENKNPLPGLDEPLQPLNMTAVGASMLPGPRQSTGRAVALLGAAASRIARKEAGVIQGAIKSGQPLADAFAGHDRFVADVLALPAAAVEGYVVDMLARAYQASKAGEGFAAQAWIDTQVAALLRLEG